ncbi:hypothetical protein EJ110_NYTH24484 [Nymphaea thermarum]|nr:hypothetical protein EJ110_NYTH24484 [Nymphaea thermarum]
MAESNKSEGGNDHKGAGNPFSYGSIIKLDGHNYELWSRSFMLSIKGHRKQHIIEEDEPIDKSGKYMTWEEDDNMVMTWIMNSVQPQIVSTITYYTTAKEILSPEYAIAKDKMLIGSKIPDLSVAYNGLSCLAIRLSQPASVMPTFVLAVGGGRGQGTTYSARGRGIGYGTNGRERFQCTYCPKMGHFENRFWDKHGRPSSMPQGRGMDTKQGKILTHSLMGSAQVATPTVDDLSSSTVSETVTISIDRSETCL